MRVHTGRPHWLILDEAHHLLPASWEPNQAAAVGELQRMVFITVHPDQILPAALQSVGHGLGRGRRPAANTGPGLQALELARHRCKPPRLRPDLAVLWPLAQGGEPYPVRSPRRRSNANAMHGNMPAASCRRTAASIFGGPEGKLNLRAQNLQMFLQLAEGVDEETWMHHLRQGDYSRWFRATSKTSSWRRMPKASSNRPAYPPRKASPASVNLSRVATCLRRRPCRCREPMWRRSGNRRKRSPWASLSASSPLK